jgi:adenine-specific DNA-methyltransferase
MSENLNDFKKILAEMFQLKQADLDFGIYRIMNQKREEIEQFLDRDLLPQVKTAFAQFEGEDLQAVRDELDKLKKTLDDAGVVAETSPKFQALQAKLSQSVDVTNLENEVFSQLTNFFRRYYQGGDFLSLRRYKAGVYAIPYEGEEVKLHWANADQYYIKSSENFRDYTFKLPSGKRAHFKLVDASTEQNNKKEQTGKERRFMLCTDSPVVEEAGELCIRFEYKVDEAGAKQTALNEAAVQTVLNLLPHPQVEGGADWKRELSALDPTDKNPRRTLLEKHLNDYTAKYSFDYFIHKDLGGFLRRELDFFIKNEVLFIDDLDVDHVRVSISKVKVIKEIGHKVIAFLEQLENFQKKLWLKKKFVVETGYCCTLDKVPEELYPAIIANAAQVEEWKRLFAIQDIEGDLHTPAYSEPLTIEFLKANPFLVIDTAFYDQEFMEKLLASFDNLDEATNGVLVCAENSQALRLLRDSYKNQVDAVITDPPYNTGDDGFLYKDSYAHSSWCSMMNERINELSYYLKSTSWLSFNINDVEFSNLVSILDVNSMKPVSVVAVKMSHMSGMKMSHADRKPPKIKEYITLSSISAEARVNPIYEKCSWWEAFDRYDSYLYKNGSDNPEDWTRTSLRNAAIDAGVDVNNDADYEAFCIKNAGYIYQRAKNDSLYELPRDGIFRKVVTSTGLDKIALDGKEVLFAANYFKEYDGEKVPTKVKGDIWEDIGINNSHNEGGVSFENGKKPVKLFERLVSMLSDDNSLIVDIFAGSGTLVHAVFNLNHKNAKRKFIAVEMADYFDNILKERVCKVMHSSEWQKGKPLKSGLSTSAIIKYIRLESYEDALNNLQLKRTPEQGSLLDQHDKLREQYMLSYMLDVESAGSASLLNIDSFTNPFNYRMNIARGNETKETVVDLVETFNWLLGIKVLRISQKEHRAAEFETDSEGRLQIKGRSRTCAAGEGWTFQEVEGQTLSGDKVLVIWRTCTTNPEQDNVMLDEWFGKRNYSTLDFEFGRIYVNGDNNLENLKVGEERWKVALIEEEFKRLMFDVEGV